MTARVQLQKEKKSRCERKGAWRQNELIATSLTLTFK
jgi:hypothetical protein